MYNYSFIIPHKNCPDLLQRCVDSIPERKDVQIIVIDDNSDADKKPYIDRKGVEVILLDAEHSKGAGRARNVGLKHAKGKWLIFADADDYYKNDFLSILDNYKETDADVVYFNFEHRNSKTGEEINTLKFQKEIVNYDGSEASKEIVKFHHNVPWTKMVSRNYITKYKICFEETINGNDILFSMMVGFYTNNIYVEKSPIYTYLRNQNSILTSKETVGAAICRLTHLVKLNYFYSFIRHPEWKKSITKMIFSRIQSLKFPFILTLCKNSYSLYKERKEWVKIFSV